MWRHILAICIIVPFSTVSASVPVRKGMGNPSECLALAIYQEARGEPLVGQMAVGLTILNRVKINHLTVCETLREDHGRQFPWVRRPGSTLLPREAPEWSGIQATASDLLAEQHDDITHGATFFFNPRICHCRLPGTITAVFYRHVFVRTPAITSFPRN